MSSQITLKNLENQEFSIVHPDGEGARSINSNEILSEIATAAEIRTGTNNTKAVTPLGLNETQLGWGQTWQFFTSPERQANIAYQNTTGKPIQWKMGVDTQKIEISEDGVTFDLVAEGAGSYGVATALIIPDGYYYRTTSNPTTTYYQIWAELR